MNLTKYIVFKFNQEADQFDKFKVNILTIFDTIISTILSVRGLTSLLDINTNSLWTYLALIICAIGYFQLFRLWHIARIIIGIEGNDEKTSDIKKG